MIILNRLNEYDSLVKSLKKSTIIVEENVSSYLSLAIKEYSNGHYYVLYNSHTTKSIHAVVEFYKTSPIDPLGKPFKVDYNINPNSSLKTRYPSSSSGDSLESYYSYSAKIVSSNWN